MSIVIRKAILPKNLSLLKYFKGRQLATAATKKNNGVLSSAVSNLRNFKNKTRPLRVGIVKTQKTKPLPTVSVCRGGNKTATLRFCASCPYIVPFSRTRRSGSPISSGSTRSILHESLLTHRKGSEPFLAPCNSLHTSHEIFNAACGPPSKASCCCPKCCPGCYGSLPPPCNTPPKCIQYMTGYYYYPYGFWFCGPYHVSGTCTPCGPCAPGGPCGPCGPCPTPTPCGPPCPPTSCICPSPACCAYINPVVDRDLEPRCQSVQAPSPALPHQKDINYPLPFDKTPTHGPQPHIKGGIAKFFPFNTIPALMPPHPAPHTTVNVCPYSTQPQTCPQYRSTYPEHKPVHCSPCIKPTLRTWLQPFSKRSESRSPIQHKRSKKVNCELRPVLESPRGLMTREQRDRPATFPGAFQYTNIPNYRKPYPPQPPKVIEYKEYET